eukprot:3396992-Rhodomonas_salina.1
MTTYLNTREEEDETRQRQRTLRVTERAWGRVCAVLSERMGPKGRGEEAAARKGRAEEPRGPSPR